MRALLVFALWIAALPAAADTLRCGTDLISLGASTYEVLSKCGEPLLRETLREPIERVRSGQALVRDDQGSEQAVQLIETEPEYREVLRLTYSPGGGSFLRFVDLYNGRVIRITLGPRS